MKRLILFLAVAASAFSQITVVAKPTLKYAKKQIWFISLSSQSAKPESISREAVMQLFPAIAEYPNDIAQDTLAAAASGNPRSWLGTLWGIVAPLGQTAAEGTALATRKNGPIYIAGAVSVAALAVQIFSSRGATPQKYFPETLPQGQITLAAGGGATYGVVADFVAAAKALGPFTIGAPAPVAELPMTVDPVIQSRIAKIMAAHEAGLEAAARLGAAVNYGWPVGANQ